MLQWDENYGATSDLVNGYAWDTAILFVQKYSGDVNYSMQSSLNNTLANTGVNGDEKCHIHDMASNCFEWITETYSGNNTNPCVCIGETIWEALQVIEILLKHLVYLVRLVFVHFYICKR